MSMDPRRLLSQVKIPNGFIGLPNTEFVVPSGARVVRLTACLYLQNTSGGAAAISVWVRQDGVALTETEVRTVLIGVSRQVTTSIQVLAVSPGVRLDVACQAFADVVDLFVRSEGSQVIWEVV